MQNVFPKTTFQDWVKHPLIVVFGIMSILLSTFVGLYYVSNNERQTDCSQTKIELQNTNDTLTKEVFQLSIENAVLRNENVQQAQVFDSVARQKRKAIINGIKDYEDRKRNN